MKCLRKIIMKINSNIFSTSFDFVFVKNYDIRRFLYGEVDTKIIKRKVKPGFLNSFFNKLTLYPVGFGFQIKGISKIDYKFWIKELNFLRILLKEKFEILVVLKIYKIKKCPIIKI
ncbi:hypothetical protein BpHYR1_012548 [Brachionus plicatilis]|uniref:Uncharacterized protein n=1 Tax=Brachionus plicatilis TaxID=10195 RepID=A0A3M7PIY6_BRAPC|nr:hypothetical protein BpHYR1_012548 [Brachionus plicatilis]